MVRDQGSKGSGLAEESFYFFGNSPGFTTKGGGVVDRVVSGSQAEEKGVQKGWRVTAIDGEAVPHTCFDSDLASRIKKAMARGGDCCQITFGVKQKEKPREKSRERQAEKPVNLAQVQKQQSCLRDLGGLSQSARRENLKELSRLNSSEAVAVLQDTQVVHGLLSLRGTEELSLLLGDKSHQQIEETLNLREALAEGRTPKLEEVRRADLGHRDSRGNTALHMARTVKSFERLLHTAELTAGSRGAAGGGRDPTRRRSCPVLALFDVRNVNGETPIQTALRHCESSLSKRADLVQYFTDYVPEIMRDNIPEVIPLVPKEERAELFKPKIAWPEIREVLLSGDAATLQQGYVKLAGRLRASLPSLGAEDHAGTWTELLAEHCFGVLESVREDGTAAGGLMHCEASRERLGIAWQGLRRLLEACADSSMPKDEFSHLKDITKGLLNATRGPSLPFLDPREPYREEFLSLVMELQGRTAAVLSDSLQAAVKAESAAAQELQQLPRDELRGVDTSPALARGAAGRLRFDSLLAGDLLRDGGGGDVGSALNAPAWVEEQNLNAELFEDLQRWGVVERASDVVDISGGGGSQEVLSAAVLEGLTEERLRFCRLHAAWLRGVCCGQQRALAERLRGAVGLAGKAAGGDGGPWQAGGGSKVTLFRTRAEAKGLPRILEKMNEALEEEVLAGRTQALLKQQAAAHAPEAGAEEDLKAAAQRVSAVRELLTPACYIVDVNGAEVVVDSFADMSALYRHLMSQSLQKDRCQVVRIKNGFSGQISAAEAASKGGYRDLKLWLMCVVDGVRLVAELQVHLRCFHELKRVMHLPYECSRGSFDHPHLVGLWRHEQPLDSRCCAGCRIS